MFGTGKSVKSKKNGKFLGQYGMNSVQTKGFTRKSTKKTWQNLVQLLLASTTPYYTNLHYQVQQTRTFLCVFQTKLEENEKVLFAMQLGLLSNICSAVWFCYSFKWKKKKWFACRKEMVSKEEDRLSQKRINTHPSCQENRDWRRATTTTTAAQFLPRSSYHGNRSLL